MIMKIKINSFVKIIFTILKRKRKFRFFEPFKQIEKFPTNSNVPSDTK